MIRFFAQGSRNYAAARLLASQQCGPGSIQAECRICVEFVQSNQSINKLYLNVERPPSQGESPLLIWGHSKN